MKVSVMALYEWFVSVIIRNVTNYSQTHV